MQQWRPYREGWHHDHCAFCQRHISLPLATDDVDAVDRGYATDDGYHWICESCFADFREQFGWTTTARRLRQLRAFGGCVSGGATGFVLLARAPEWAGERGLARAGG